MPLVKESSGMRKEFSDDKQTYSFIYLPDPTDTVGSSTWTFEDEEQVRQDFWYRNIKKGDIILDIGASFGSYTLSALAMGATVYAFSPEHEFPKIRKSMEENRGFKQRCYIYDFGFYSETGFFKTDTALFYKKNELDEDKIRQAKLNGLYGWYIPVKRVDDFIPTLKLDKIDFIKIDTEGAEFEILKGGLETLKRYRPKLLIEFHLFKDHAIGGKCHDLLEEIGYYGRAHVYHTNTISHGFYLPSSGSGSGSGSA